MGLPVIQGLKVWATCAETEEQKRDRLGIPIKPEPVFGVSHDDYVACIAKASPKPSERPVKGRIEGDQRVPQDVIDRMTNKGTAKPRRLYRYEAPNKRSEYKSSASDQRKIDYAQRLKIRRYDWNTAKIAETGRIKPKPRTLTVAEQIACDVAKALAPYRNLLRACRFKRAPRRTASQWQAECAERDRVKAEAISKWRPEIIDADTHARMTAEAVELCHISSDCAIRLFRDQNNEDRDAPYKGRVLRSTEPVLGKRRPIPLTVDREKLLTSSTEFDNKLDSQRDRPSGDNVAPDMEVKRTWLVDTSKKTLLGTPRYYFECVETDNNRIKNRYED
jgi:hypothetical protein